ncbi:hypothetical protein FNV43_RR00519 [Rhamnella rubrinervis]|uniref:Uncharacterized protein n=1 Tax=Rhamnella rubrinervis TaxID=2594499 RepID=A0A8K0HN70_9ROSA|nr:hypothetical protein FNV43_RR00519 [Rhamnella rubrinervis]
MYLLMHQCPLASLDRLSFEFIRSIAICIGFDEDFARHELEGKRQDVATFLHGEVMIPIRGGGHYYISTRRFEQMQTDHRHKMAVDEDPEEVAKKDPEEKPMGSKDYVPFGYSLELVDPKNFDPWDDLASD